MTDNVETESSARMVVQQSQNKWRPKLKDVFPIVGMLSSGYSSGDAISDGLAGFTVGLSVIPMSIAFAAIADLPPQYGLYSSFMGSFVYVLMGSVPAVTVGPTTLMALMIQKYVMIHQGYAPFLALCNGLVIFACGILRLGFIVDFVSTPVISSYTSAASVTIICNQLKSLFGIKIINKSKLPGVLKTLEELFTNITSIRWQDSILGICCIFILILLKELPSSKCVTSVRNDFRRQWSKKSLWLLSISRNALVVLICAFIAYGVDGDQEDSEHTFILTGNIIGGLPHPDLPMFGINKTETITDPNLGEVLAELGSVLVTLPMISILCQIAISKAFSKTGMVDATQEMLALGASNLLGSFFLSMPVCASFGRTAVNSASGVKTTLGGIVTGSVVLLALGVMMPYCAFIPKTSLAAVVVCAVVFSIEYQIALPMWRSKKIDLIPALITFFGCLFWSLEYGILVGIGANLLLILYHTARPNVSSSLQIVDENCSEQLWITLDHGWSYPASSHIRNKIDLILSQNNHIIKNLTIIIDMSNIDFLDFSAANAIRDLVSHYKKLGQHIILFKLREPLRLILQNASHKNVSLTFVDSTSDLPPSHEVSLLIQ